jgi:hypothetical protein
MQNGLFYYNTKSFKTQVNRVNACFKQFIYFATSTTLFFVIIVIIIIVVIVIMVMIIIVFNHCRIITQFVNIIMAQQIAQIFVHRRL